MESTPGSWSHAPFFCLKTELSPATLFHSASNYFGCFGGLPERGLGGPAFAAYASKTGIKIAKAGEAMDAPMMDECWMLVWFAGAKGWTNWDSPGVVFLQKKPRRMNLDEGGLHFEFPGAAGDIVLLPLYGYFKPPTEKVDLLAAHGLPSKKIKTWQWSEALPKGPLMRVRYWASALREFPVYCEESFSVDRARGSVTIRQRFQWRAIDDDWNTKHLKLAPLSPPLALASRDQTFPVTFSGSVLDHDLFTPHGPYMGVEGADTVDATFQVLHHVNETEFADPPATNAPPGVLAAIEQLRSTSRAKFRSPERYEYDHGGLENFALAVAGDQWYAKALPYMDEPTRAIALASLRKYFHDDVLTTNRFQWRESPSGSGGTYPLLRSKGMGSTGDPADAGTSSAPLLETLWAYAHFSGDWDLIKERWPLVKQLFTAPPGAGWVSFAQEAGAELGGGAPHCVAMARMAYKVGDMDAYNYACYRFARGLVHHQIKQTGAEYFRRHQPLHSMEAMDGEVYPTKTSGELATIAAPDKFSGSPSGVLASCLAVIRASHPTRYQRLIPEGPPTPFVAGLEREVAGPNSSLVQTVLSGSPGTQSQPASNSWPQLTWETWKTPTGAMWTFGKVSPVRKGVPANIRTVPLNWNCEAVAWSW